MNSPANWPNSEKPMPMGRISVGKISDTYRYMVVSQKVLGRNQHGATDQFELSGGLTPGRPGIGK